MPGPHDTGVISAAWFQTFIGKSRPYLVDEAKEAIELLNTHGLTIKPGPGFLLLILSDEVDSSHGQFYGSWEKLCDRFGFKASTLFDWLNSLRKVGLVAPLGYQPGRITTTWQVLPHRYLLVSGNPDTRNPDTSDTPALRSLLVSGKWPAVLSENPDTNIRTSLTTAVVSPRSLEDELDDVPELPPRQPDESMDDFVARVNKEKYSS